MHPSSLLITKDAPLRVSPRLSAPLTVSPTSLPLGVSDLSLLSLIFLSQSFKVFLDLSSLDLSLLLSASVPTGILY